MGGPLAGAALAVSLAAGLGYVLARVPRRLIRDDLGAAHGAGAEAALALGLAAVGLATAILAGLAPLALFPLTPAVRLWLGGGVMTLAAVIYYDARFLVIPDLCTALLAVLATASPLALPLADAAMGAAVCAALFGGVALAWRLRTGADGLGLGDVKLSAALGALLGLEHALWAVALGAVGGAAWGYGRQALAGGLGSPAADHASAEGHAPAGALPFGAALALAGGGVWLGGVWLWARR